MKIGVIQASSQISRNRILYELTKEKAQKREVINFGCFENESEKYSYIEIAILIGLLLSSKAVDFIITGCSSGQGMMTDKSKEDFFSIENPLFVLYLLYKYGHLKSLNRYYYLFTENQIERLADKERRN